MEIAKIGCPPFSRGVKVFGISELFNPVKNALEEHDISISITSPFSTRGNKSWVLGWTPEYGAHSLQPLVMQDGLTDN